MSPLPYRTKGGLSQEAEEDGRGEVDERGRGTEADTAGLNGGSLLLSGRFGRLTNAFSSTCLGERKSSVRKIVVRLQSQDL